MAESAAVLEGALTLIRGDNPWEKPLTFYTDDGVTPLDLTGLTVEAEMRWRPNNSQMVTVTVDDAAAGEVTLSLTAAQTAALPFGRLATLFVQLIEGTRQETWLRASIEVEEGLDS